MMNKWSSQDNFLKLSTGKDNVPIITIPGKKQYLGITGTVIYYKVGKIYEVCALQMQLFLR